MLHVLNGDGTAASFNESIIEGEVVVWREALIMGPCPGNVSAEDWQRIRAQHLADAYESSVAECSASLKEQEEILNGASRYNEIVLWFEFDLFCQTNLTFTLNSLARLGAGLPKTSLICIDSFPGIDNFRGLSQLGGDQLTGLFEDRLQISPPALSLAAEIWDAYTAQGPEKLIALLAKDLSALPYARDAFQAHLERFPSTRNGLGRIENTLLNLIAGGIDEFGPLFHMIGELEPIYGLGDWQVWRHLDEMSKLTNPLITIHDVQNVERPLTSNDYREAYFKLTDSGRAVLVGNSDMMNINHIDYWLGGVHVTNEIPWRWDDAEEQIIKIT